MGGSVPETEKGREKGLTFCTLLTGNGLAAVGRQIVLRLVRSDAP